MAELQTLYEGDYLRLQRIDTWEFVVRANARGAVVIVAVTPDDELLLVEQPRPALGRSVLELPAGLVGDIAGEEDEALAVAAARELEEETGYRAARMTYMTGGPPSAGLSAETLWFYRAHELTRIHDGGGDDSEQITVHAVPMHEVDDWLAAREAEGTPVDPKIYTGLYFIRRERR
ncbi:NUDIX hydrolase [Salinisphaera sp. SPP-AMP-43]|uniref:NUDIX hydrolase n=1 Tax=Salinisphaera sp. SPP-AMP-43 TaxID=3121288 RepID=UPI003C6E7FDF